MRLSKHVLLSTAAAAGLALMASPALAAGKYDPGASDTEIKIGNTMPYSGPLAAYSRIGKTMGAYFDKLNIENGGINGRKITFISVDDGYNPAKTKEVVRRLIEKDKVLLLFGNLGTPTNSVVRKYINKKKVPHLFLATGATKWANPKKFPWTMGWNAAYQAEAMIYAKHILKNIKGAKIAVLYQNDDYGKDYLHGLQAGLGRMAKKMIIKMAPYETADPSIKSHILALKSSGANVFANFSTPRAAIQSMAIKNIVGWNAAHYLNNVSGNTRFLLAAGFNAKTGLARADGTITTEYLKDFRDPEWKNDAGMAAYVKFLRNYAPQASPGNGVNAYAYAVTQLMAHVLEKAGDNLTRKNIMKQAASIRKFEIDILLPGITINTSATDYRTLEQMRLVKFDGKLRRYKALSPIVTVKVPAGS